MPLYRSFLICCSILLFSFTSVFAETQPRLRPNSWATPIISANFDNWYKVDDLVYRSEQPGDEDFLELSRFGIKRILNLRNFHSDNDEMKISEIPMTLYRVPMQAEDITIDEIVAALNAIKAAKTPILVHCWHGSDRTGTVIAMYRILYQGWLREAALDELINGGYGYHPIYKSIPDFVLTVDLNLIRDRLQHSE